MQSQQPRWQPHRDCTSSLVPALKRTAMMGKRCLILARPGTGGLVQRIIFPGVIFLIRQNVEELMRECRPRGILYQP